MTNEITLPWPGWTVTKLLGAGGYGRVYEIHREQYGVRESAAVKILSFPRDSDEVAEILHSGYVEETLAAEYHQQVENVLREYRVLMKLKGNPNIVICDTYDVVPHEDGIGSDVFIRMELLTPLKKYLIGNPATPERAVQLGVAMCDALSCCWKHKILHRDIKPENILVSNDGIFKLSDFGEAKLVEKTMASGVAGTWSFVAPEVGNHNRYSEPADIYSLGMVLYWMLNYSMLPFLPRPWGLCTMAEQDEARNRRLSGEPLPPPAEGSPALQAVVLKACSFRPEDRYARPEEFRAALLAALEPGADEPSANWQRAQAENRPVDNDAPTADEGSMGNNWVSGGSPLHEATMPTDDDDDPTMPDPTKTAQTGSRASSHANAQPVKGNDLYREVMLTPEQAADGCKVTVDGYKGTKLMVTIPPHSQNGKQFRCSGRGYPSLNGGENGDLYVTVQVRRTSSHTIERNIKLSWSKATRGGMEDVVEEVGENKAQRRYKIPIPAGVVMGEKLFYPNVKSEDGSAVSNILVTVGISNPLVGISLIIGIVSFFVLPGLFYYITDIPLTALGGFICPVVFGIVMETILEAVDKSKFGPKTPEEIERCKTPRDMSSYM